LNDSNLFHPEFSSGIHNSYYYWTSNFGQATTSTTDQLIFNHTAFTLQSRTGN